jgi:hypothetical protein
MQQNVHRRDAEHAEITQRVEFRALAASGPDGQHDRILLYFSVLMNRFSRTISSKYMPSIILIAVIASLCFSVGEGLRLTPFPTSHVSRVEARNTPLTAKASDQISSHKYGPLDVPTQMQKRNKRQAAAFDVPPSSFTSEVLIPSYSAPTHETFDIVAVPVVSQFAGRAPPFLS